MAAEGTTVVEVLGEIRDAILASGPGGISQPQLAIGPVEEVLVFNDDEFIALKNFPADPYLSSHGFLTDIYGRALPNSKLEAAFPFALAKVPEQYTWPPPQPQPFYEPPVLSAHTTPPGASKQLYDFGDGNAVVTVGPSLPKLVKLKSGGAQFTVSSIGVISQGKGSYDGAKGLAAYAASAYFQSWPDGPQEQIELLIRGFNVRSTIVVRLVKRQLVSAGDAAGAPPPPGAAPPKSAAPPPAAAPPKSAAPTPAAAPPKGATPPSGAAPPQSAAPPRGPGSSAAPPRPKAPPKKRG
jgi:hypothetical protein